MFTRLGLLVGWITAVMVVAWAAAASASSPTTVRPSASVTSAMLTGSSVHFVVEVTFAPPAHSPAASACRGRVELSKAANPHHKAPHWTGALALHGDVCRARISAKLPAALVDRSVRFTIAFD